jgi:tRNA(Arg) A34 adenosine deaminase TadA
MSSLDVFVRAATSEALQSKLKFKHGCVIFHGHKIVAQGHNNMQERGWTKACHSCHAEIAAIKRLPKRFQGEERGPAADVDCGACVF